MKSQSKTDTVAASFLGFLAGNDSQAPRIVMSMNFGCVTNHGSQIIKHVFAASLAAMFEL